MPGIYETSDSQPIRGEPTAPVQVFGEQWTHRTSGIAEEGVDLGKASSLEAAEKLVLRS